MTSSSNRQDRLGCVIHCRVSTSKQAYEGESLDLQCDICRRIAVTRGWTLLREPWKENYSGRKDARPVFDEILAFIDAHPGQVRYYIFRSIDRFTRSGAIEYERMRRAIERRGVELVDSLGLIQPSINTLEHLDIEYPWSRVRPSKTAEIIEAEKAAQEVSTILTRLIGQEISLRRRGYKIRQAVDGFVNVKIVVDGRKRVVEAPDPERAKYYVAMFELRAAGQLSDEQICERVNAMGFRSRVRSVWNGDHSQIVGRKGGTPLTPRRLLEAIRRPIYAGIICEKWTAGQPVKAAYNGLVPIATFNAANRGKIAIVQHAATQFELRRGLPQASVARRSKENPLFPLRLAIRCPLCRMPFLGSSPRGRSGQRFPTYHCGRRHRYFGVPKHELESAVARYVGRLRFRVDAHAALRMVIGKEWDEQEAKVRQVADDARRHAETLAARKNEAIRAFQFATGDAMRRGLEAEVEDIERQQRASRSTGLMLDISMDDVDEYLADVRHIVEHPSILLASQANPSQFEVAYRMTFEVLPTYDEIVSRTAKLAWVFSFLADFEPSKTALVRPTVPEWNRIEETILLWKASKGALQSLLHSEAADAPIKHPPERP